ncbi:hypothetical protein THAOC_03943, partial [Thalassiosira oceanica]
KGSVGKDLYSVAHLGGGSGGDETGGGGAGRQHPMPGQFVGLYQPVGRAKSTRADDEEFVKCLGRSEKECTTFFY